jgi:hypothetical protein
MSTLQLALEQQATVLEGVHEAALETIFNKRSVYMLLIEFQLKN